MTAYGKRLSAWAAGIITTAVLVAPGYAQDKKVRFILDWAFQGQQAPFTVAADDGTFKKYKLDVTVDRGFGSGDTVAKVASGAYDMGLADLYSVVRFNGANPDHQLLAVMMVHDKSALAVETKAAGPIKTPQDLNGRSIAAPVGDASRQLIIGRRGYSGRLRSIKIARRSPSSISRRNCIARCLGHNHLFFDLGIRDEVGACSAYLPTASVHRCAPHDRVAAGSQISKAYHSDTSCVGPSGSFLQH
jgi:ABC-type taurine transport system substrate-binding protein